MVRSAVQRREKNGRIRNEERALALENLGIGDTKEPPHVRVLRFVEFEQFVAGFKVRSTIQAGVGKPTNWRTTLIGPHTGLKIQAHNRAYATSGTTVGK